MSTKRLFFKNTHYCKSNMEEHLLYIRSRDAKWMRRTCVPEAGIKGRDKQSHLMTSLGCNYLLLPLKSGGCLNIKMPSYQYRDPHVKDKTVLRPSYLLTWESPYRGKTVFILRQGPASDTQLIMSYMRTNNVIPISQNKHGVTRLIAFGFTCYRKSCVFIFFNWMPNEIVESFYRCYEYFTKAHTNWFIWLTRFSQIMFIFPSYSKTLRGVAISEEFHCTSSFDPSMDK